MTAVPREIFIDLHVDAIPEQAAPKESVPRLIYRYLTAFVKLMVWRRLHRQTGHEGRLGLRERLQPLWALSHSEGRAPAMSGNQNSPTTPSAQYCGSAT